MIESRKYNAIFRKLQITVVFLKVLQIKIFREMKINFIRVCIFKKKEATWIIETKTLKSIFLFYITFYGLIYKYFSFIIFKKSVKEDPIFTVRYMIMIKKDLALIVCPLSQPFWYSLLYILNCICELVKIKPRQK